MVLRRTQWEESRWHNQKNGLLQGRALSLVLFNVYTNDQHVHNETRSFINADDQRIATQRSTFEQTETILTEAYSILFYWIMYSNIRNTFRTNLPVDFYPFVLCTYIYVYVSYVL